MEPGDGEGLFKLEFSCFHADATTTYAYIQRSLLIRDGWNINDALKTDWLKIHGEKRLGFSDNEDESCFYNEGLQFFRIVLNSILYLSSNDPDVVEVFNKKRKGKKRKKKMKPSIGKKSDTSILDFIYVGKNAESTDQEKEAQQNKNFPSGKINVRFIARGHWRNQPYGPGLKKKKLIWVKPYYQGPDMADLINKPYSV